MLFSRQIPSGTYDIFSFSVLGPLKPIETQALTFLSQIIYVSAGVLSHLFRSLTFFFQYT